MAYRHGLQYMPQLPCQRDTGNALATARNRERLDVPWQRMAGPCDDIFGWVLPESQWSTQLPGSRGVVGSFPHVTALRPHGWVCCRTLHRRFSPFRGSGNPLPCSLQSWAHFQPVGRHCMANNRASSRVRAKGICVCVCVRLNSEKLFTTAPGA